MSYHEHEQDQERLFSLSEANQLIPQLESLMATIQRGKAFLFRINQEIRRAASKASEGGGTPVGSHYIRTLHAVATSLHTIHELGVVVKDLDVGLCDFPHLRHGRVVYLCWKFGEKEIRWWHELTNGYNDRQPIEEPH
ncbi:MAG: DUF2203 domain-containing protein [Nitrospira sp.]